jgi:signal transduction histidine kinase
LLRTESFRLTAIFAGLITGAMLIVMVIIYVIMHQAFRTELLSVVDNDLTSIESGFKAEGISEASEVIDQRLFKAGASDFFVLETVDGRKVAGNLPAMAPRLGVLNFAVPAPLLGRGENPEAHAILGKGAMLSPKLYVFAGRDLYLALATEEKIVRTLGWILAVTLLLAVGGGVLLSNAFLGRIDAITRTCQAIMAGRLMQRIPERGSRDELDQLVRTINAMLDRINILIENVQQISSDIAHDLRMPLTRLRHRLELAYNEAASVEQYRAAVEGAISESETLLTVFTALLQLGQIETATDTNTFERIDLSKLLVELADIYRPAAEDANHILDTDITPDIEILGNRTLLSQAFVNLIENALAPTPAGTNITIGLKKAESGWRASIDDNGPGIPEGERDKIFRRFYRLEQGRSTPGSGLGLALVAAIARYHSATIELGDNLPGLSVSIVFKY